MGIGIYAFGHAADRFGRKPTFFTWMLGAAIMVVLYSRLTDPTALLFAGAVIESGATAEILSVPRHAYTRALIAAGPRYDRPDAGLEPVPEALVANLRLEVEGVGR